MRRKALTIFTCVLFACLTSRAGYLVYRADYQVNLFVKDVNDEWLFEWKTQSVKFSGYFLFEEHFDVANANAPARIITFNSKKSYFPATYNFETQSWIVDTSYDKPVKRFIVFPMETPWPDESRTTTVADNYCGTIADRFYMFGGVWSSVQVEKSLYKKHVFSLMDYYGSDVGSENATSQLEKSDWEKMDEDERMILPTDVKGYSEIMTGLLKKDYQPPMTMSGNLSFYKDSLIGKSVKAVLRYDKKMTERVLTGDEDSMGEAVNVLTDYLVSKKYASTWVE